MTKKPIPLSDLQVYINQQLRISVEYQGKLRLIEPHALGGDPVKLRAYQLFPEEGWRLFTAEELSYAWDFTPRPDYNPEDKAMKGNFLARVKVEKPLAPSAVN